MNGQYLEAHAFLKTLRDKGVPYTETLLNLMQYAVIEDVAPVVHAQWTFDKEYTRFKCSNCGGGMVRNVFAYCPWCGAKMDGGEL